MRSFENFCGTRLYRATAVTWVECIRECIMDTISSVLVLYLMKIKILFKGVGPTLIPTAPRALMLEFELRHGASQM